MVKVNEKKYHIVIHTHSIRKMSLRKTNAVVWFWRHVGLYSVVPLSPVISTCAQALILYDVPVRKVKSLHRDFIVCSVITHDAIHQSQMSVCSLRNAASYTVYHILYTASLYEVVCW